MHDANMFIRSKSPHDWLQGLIFNICQTAIEIIQLATSCLYSPVFIYGWIKNFNLIKRTQLSNNFIEVKIDGVEEPADELQILEA